MVDAPDVVEVVLVDLSEAVVISVTADFPDTMDGIDDIVVPKKGFIVVWSILNA